MDALTKKDAKIVILGAVKSFLANRLEEHLKIMCFIDEKCSEEDYNLLEAQRLEELRLIEANLNFYTKKM